MGNISPEEWEQVGKSPVSEANPGGESCRYDEAFERASAKLKRLLERLLPEE